MRDGYNPVLVLGVAVGYMDPASDRPRVVFRRLRDGAFMVARTDGFGTMTAISAESFDDARSLINRALDDIWRQMFGDPD